MTIPVNPGPDIPSPIPPVPPIGQPDRALTNPIRVLLQVTIRNLIPICRVVVNY
jgi:hypothetical protein